MSHYSYKLNPAQKEFLEFVDVPGYDIDVALYQGGFGS